MSNSSPFNGDGQQSQYRLRIPILLAAGVVDFLASNGVIVSAASATPSDVVLTVAVAGIVNCLALIHLARWIVR
jgi:hypothetical protein